MYQIKVNDKYDHTIERSGDSLLLDGNKTGADVKQLSTGKWHIINELRSYNVELISFNNAEKTAEIKVNNNIYLVSAKDQFDLLLEKLGLSDLNLVKISELKAPMPGLVLKIFVEEGASIKKGDSLFVLEAMKMENIIRSPDDVTVKTIKIKPGDKVEKGQVLLQFG